MIVADLCEGIPGPPMYESSLAHPTVTHCDHCHLRRFGHSPPHPARHTLTIHTNISAAPSHSTVTSWLQLCPVPRRPATQRRSYWSHRWSADHGGPIRGQGSRAESLHLWRKVDSPPHECGKPWVSIEADLRLSSTTHGLVMEQCGPGCGSICGVGMGGVATSVWPWCPMSPPKCRPHMVSQRGARVRGAAVN